MAGQTLFFQTNAYEDPTRETEGGVGEQGRGQSLSIWSSRCAQQVLSASQIPVRAQAYGQGLPAENVLLPVLILSLRLNLDD